LVALAQQEPVGHETTAADGEAEGHGVVPPGGGEIVGHPPYWMVAPFALLLLAIAVLPLVPGAAHWWESNLNRFLVAGGLGLATLAYYLVLFDRPVVPEWPAHGAMTQPDRAGLDYGVSLTVLENAILGEYIPFITLLFALYTISGGIRIQGDLPAWPSTNAAFLAVGALLANLIGTTGAAMLLIRPLLETNSERRHVKHTVVFFIFAVCNCGGCLTPLGDPPLFLGYLRGVDFLWTVRLWPEWLFVNGSLVVIYYLWDRWWAYPKETPRDLALDETRVRGLQFMGVWPNAALLVGVVLAVALLDPSKPLPGTAWRPWMYLREATQLTLVALSLLLGSAAVRRMNQFNFAAIIEVAALFFGIFLCMQPPLQILHVRGPSLGLATPAHFFWATGSLSSVLDNAPTYVVFFETARSLPSAGATVAGVAEPLLAAVSLGAVFMGAMTYIGNGPNFMVRAIAEKSGIAMPSFFGYLAYSVLVLVPRFAACTWLFL
jgi:Na+/H+ antiporter NhaD/arsenite permease-like protein